MEPTDPLEGETYVVRLPDEDGDVTEIELTVGQLLDVAAGKVIVYTPHDEEILVDEDGQIVERESWIPPDEAA